MKTDSLSPAERAALRKLAKEATPGPWAWSNKEWRVSASDMWAVAHYEERCAALDADDYDAPGMYHEPIIQTDSGAYGPRESDREYIAAASPQVVLGLLEELERAEQERDRFYRHLRACENHVKELEG